MIQFNYDKKKRLSAASNSLWAPTRDTRLIVEGSSKMLEQTHAFVVSSGIHHTEMARQASNR